MKTFLLFDFDGVIVDSFEAAYACSKLGTREEYKKLFYGNVYEEIEKNYPGKDNEIPVAEDPFFSNYIPRLMALDPVVGMPDVLSRLAQSHTMAVVSSTINAPIQAFLDKHDIAAHFDTVMGADVHKSKVHKIKLAFDMYDAVPEQCLFITDTLGDMREAGKAGVAALGVSWGWHDHATLAQGSPIAIADTPSQLHDAIQAWRTKMPAVGDSGQR